MSPRNRVVLRIKQMRVSPIVFNQSVRVCSAAITISALAGPDGRLVLGFTWQEEISEANLVERIKGYVEGLVERLTCQQTSQNEITNTPTLLAVCLVTQRNEDEQHAEIVSTQ